MERKPQTKHLSFPIGWRIKEPAMATIPKDKNPESTLSLLSNGYAFVQKKCRQNNSDIFQTRLLFQRSICMRGKEAAELFYDNYRFMRKKAAPKRVKKTLLGEGGVQGLDDEAHKHRKRMFMEVMSPENIERLNQLVEKYWKSYLKKWEKMEHVQLFEEVQELLSHAVSEWAGLPLSEEEGRKRARQLGAMIDGSGAIGFRHYKGRIGRQKTESWLKEVIKDVREEKRKVKEDSVVHHMIWHKDHEDKFLDKKIAAVEILNILRPTVAIARFIIFEALALHENPEYLEKLQKDAVLRTNFVHEVRRYYPFFPLAVAKVRNKFEWNGYAFPKGRRVFLDLYGTNRHPADWQDPDEFKPERFEKWDESAYNFIPQGGGDHFKNHRCAGEWITIEVMKTALKLLTRDMSYEVPEQDLSINLSRIPAIPESRFIITNVRQKR